MNDCISQENEQEPLDDTTRTAPMRSGGGGREVQRGGGRYCLVIITIVESHAYAERTARGKHGLMYH